MKILVGLLLIVHGLISASQSGGSFKPGKGAPNPEWLKWWPTRLGKSWLFSLSGIEGSPAGTVAGILWLISGTALVGSAMGLFGFLVPTAWWRALAAVGASMSLFMLVVYAHPLYLVGIGANLAILIVLLGAKWPPLGGI